MKKIESVSDLLNNVAQYGLYYSKDGSTIEEATIFKMPLCELLTLIEQGLFFKEKENEGRWGQGGPGSDSYFSMRD